MTVEHVAIEVSEDRRHDAGSWRADSVCRKFPTRWWFGGDHRETARAKDICSGCVVRVPCLEFALGRPELLGVWAATTPSERAAMRRPVGAPATDVEIEADGEVLAEARVAVAAPAPVRLQAGLPVGRVVDVRAEVGAEVRIDLVLDVERHFDRNELFTPAEAARRLGVTPNTVTRWSRAGKIASIQTMGGHRRFRRSEIERVLSEANLDASVPI